MTRLQVEMANARKRISSAVSKRIECDYVNVEFGTFTVSVHAWKDSDIIASVYVPANSTVKQIVQQVRTEI